MGLLKAETHAIVQNGLQAMLQPLAQIIDPKHIGVDSIRLAGKILGDLWRGDINHGQHAQDRKCRDFAALPVV